VPETLKLRKFQRLTMALTAQDPTSTDGHIQARRAPEQVPQAGMIGMT
jgi:hypothetical protein